MPKSNTKALSFKRTLNLNSSSNQINGNIFIKRKTITLKTPNTIKVEVGKKITGKISLKKINNLDLTNKVMNYSSLMRI
jgi:hypothetical protein